MFSPSLLSFQLRQLLRLAKNLTLIGGGTSLLYGMLAKINRFSNNFCGYQ
jgi:hypothetical protein